MFTVTDGSQWWGKHRRMAGYAILGEAIALGLASGPGCLAVCGPVLVPSLLAERAGVRPVAGYLFVFLGARLLGYLIFAAVAWECGALIQLPLASRAFLVGAVDVILAIVLAWYAYSIRFVQSQSCPGPGLVQIGAVRVGRRGGAAALGLLTGLNLCPPFIVAGVRAAESGSLPYALLFFVVFFIGTSVWFAPLTSVGCVARNEGVVTVARMTMALVAVYYLFLGIASLIGGRVYGYKGL